MGESDCMTEPLPCKRCGLPAKYAETTDGGFKVYRCKHCRLTNIVSPKDGRVTVISDVVV